MRHGCRWSGHAFGLRAVLRQFARGHESGIDRGLAVRAGWFLPVAVGPVVRGQDAAGGRELEFIVRSLVELKLQLEELRRRVDDGRPSRGEMVGEVRLAPRGAVAGGYVVGAIEPAQSAPANVLEVRGGMTMAEIEKAAIIHALRETRANRRKAAEMLGIGERTLYRKLKEYNLSDGI